MAGSGRGARLGPLVHLVAGLALVSVSCTGSSGSGMPDGAYPRSAGSQAPSSAPPGKYRTLPEPCGAVPKSVLARLLPGTAAASPSPGKPGRQGGSGAAQGAGKATLTYDTDRRVGCEWSGQGASWNRHLRVDFERVISYDPAVSDEQRAEEEYLKAANQARVPSGSASGPAAEASDVPGETAQSAGGTGSGSSSDFLPASSPRIISGIGDQAFLEERTATDTTQPHRAVIIVFREENVLVTVELREWPAADGRLSSSSVMEIHTHLVAQELANLLKER